MQRLTVEKKFPDRLKEDVSDFENSRVIEDEGILYNQHGEFVALYAPKFFKENFFDFFNKIKYPHSNRLSGLTSTSHIFGAAGRDFVKSLPTRFCKFNKKYPKHYYALNKIVEITTKELYAKYLPNELLAHQKSLSEKISPFWNMPNDIYTSGIINRNTKYRYHTDNRNLEGTFSTMLVLKHGTQGGDLHLPEYDILLKLKNNSILIFDGRNTSHGVTPFWSGGNGARMTIVFYCMETIMRAEKNLEEELKVFNERTTRKSFNVE